jgi:hypothetical protein
VWDKGIGFMRVSGPVRGTSPGFFLDVEIGCVVAKAHFESGIHAVPFLAAAKREFLSASIASDDHFNTWDGHGFPPAIGKD